MRIVPRRLALLASVALAGGLAVVAEVRAQEDPACVPGQDCEVATHWGAWGLILLGFVFLAVWFVPPRRPGHEEEEGLISRLPMMQALQRRIDKELSGWRRLQWPALAAFFILLGVATLAGWR